MKKMFSAVGLLLLALLIFNHFYPVVALPNTPKYTITVRYVDAETGRDISASKKVQAPLNVYYTPGLAGVAGYTKPASQRIKVTKAQTIIYRYKPQNFTVTIKHQHATTKQAMAGDTKATVKYNRAYTAMPKTINGYVSSSKKQITVKGNTTVTMYYTPKNYTVNIKHLSSKTGLLVAKEQNVVKKFGESYSVPVHTIYGYKKPTIQTITVNDNKSIVYRYEPDIAVMTKMDQAAKEFTAQMPQRTDDVIYQAFTPSITSASINATNYQSFATSIKNKLKSNNYVYVMTAQERSQQAMLNDFNVRFTKRFVEQTNKYRASIGLPAISVINDDFALRYAATRAIGGFMTKAHLPGATVLANKASAYGESLVPTGAAALNTNLTPEAMADQALRLTLYESADLLAGNNNETGHLRNILNCNAVAGAVYLDSASDTYQYSSVMEFTWPY